MDHIYNIENISQKGDDFGMKDKIAKLIVDNKNTVEICLKQGCSTVDKISFLVGLVLPYDINIKLVSSLVLWIRLNKRIKRSPLDEERMANIERYLQKV